MKRAVSLLAGLLVPVAMVSAATLSTGSYVMPVGQSSNLVSIGITGGGAVGSMDVLLIIGDGGPDVGGSTNQATSPKIVGGTILTGIFAGNNTGDQFQAVLPGNQLLGFNAGVTNTGTVNGEGVLATFTISTVGAAPGVYTLSLDPTSTDVNGAPAQIVGGTITILPEPASALLLIGALPFLRRRSA